MSWLVPWYTPFWYVEIEPETSQEEAVNIAMAEGARNAWPCPEYSYGPPEETHPQRERLASAIDQKPDKIGYATSDDIVVQASGQVAEKLSDRPEINWIRMFVRDCKWASEYLGVPGLRCPPGVLEKAVIPTVTVGVIGVTGRFLDWW